MGLITLFSMRDRDHFCMCEPLLARGVSTPRPEESLTKPM